MKKKILTALKITLYCLLAVSVVIWIRAVILSCIEVSSYHSFSLTVRFAFNALISYIALPAAFADMLYCLRYFESDKKTIVKTVANCLFILLSVGMIEFVIRKIFDPYGWDGTFFYFIYFVGRGIYAVACLISNRVNRFPEKGKGRIIPIINILVASNIITYLLAFLIFPIFDLLGLLFLLLNVIFIPALFCGYIKRLAKSSEVSRKRKTTIIWSSASAMIAADILACIIKFQGILVYYLPAKGVLYLICAIWALLNYHLDSPSGNKRAAKILTVTFATVSLILNALLFFPLAPWHELIYYEVLLILPFLFAIISISSYLIGKMVSKPHIRVKLTAWLLGIIASLLSLAGCFGAFDFSLIVLGILAAGIMFIFCLVGVSHQEKKRELMNDVQS